MSKTDRNQYTKAILNRLLKLEQIVSGLGLGGGGATAILIWSADTAYVEGELAIKPDVANGVVVRRLAAGTSESTWLLDFENWEYVSQREIALSYIYNATTTKMLGEQLYIAPIIFQSNITDQTRAGFDGLEQTDWDSISAG